MFSLRTLFLVVGVAALGVAAIAAQVYWLISSFVGVSVILSLWAVVERHKPFWGAYAVFSVGYFLAQGTFGYQIRDMLPTHLMIELWRLSEPPESLPLGADPFAPFPENLQRAKIAAWHCTFAVLLGLCAGLFYQWRTKREEQRKGRT